MDYERQKRKEKDMPDFKRVKDGWKLDLRTVDGRRVRRKLGPEWKRGQVEAYCVDLRSKAVERKVTGKSGHTFADAVVGYLGSGGKAAGILDDAVIKWGRKDVRDVSGEMVLSLAKEHYGKRKPQTMKRWGVTPIKAVLNWASEEGREWRQPVRVPSVKVEAPKKRKAAPEGWLQKFCQAADEQGAEGYSELAQYMAVTGRRLKDALSLKWEDFDARGRRIYVKQTKSGEPIEVPLTPRMTMMLVRLWGKQGKPQACCKLFGINYGRWVWKKWQKICERAGIEYVRPHSAGRATFATTLRKKHGMSLDQILDAGGWSPSSYAMVASVYIDDDENRRNAVTLLDGEMGE